MELVPRNELRRPQDLATELAPEDREYLIQKLAEILVLDYQALTASTVQTGSLMNREPGGVAKIFST